MTEFSTTSLLAAASEILRKSGYQEAQLGAKIAGLPTEARVFEDLYSVVALTVYDTWPQLAEGWKDAQAALTTLMSKKLTRNDAKSSDGYLVLATPGKVPETERRTAEFIRSNTRYVRKLLIVGGEIQGVADVRRAMSPLLPVELKGLAPLKGSALDLLPTLLSEKGVDASLVSALIDAFREQDQLMERLQQWITKGGEQDED